MLGKENRKYNGIYRGLVISNEDQDKLGRVRVRVFPMFSGVSTDDLPLAKPAMPLFEGAGNSIGCFCVPDVGTYVWVFFEEGDFYQPVYFAEAQTAVHGIPSESSVNYPNRKVIKSSSGFVVYIDDTDKVLKVQHPSGSYILLTNDVKVEASHPSGSRITLEANGDITGYAKKDLNITAGNDINLSAAGHLHITATNDNSEPNPVDISITGDALIHATQNVTIKGDVGVSINP